MALHEWKYDELRSLLCGSLIGKGAARDVYDCRLDADYVVKLETTSVSFQNVEEWQTWWWLENYPHKSKWFAPCKFISTCGYALLQRKTVPIPTKQLPKKIPFYLSDIKPENFGLLDGKIVCIDYGTVLSAIRQAPNRLITPKWK